MPDEAARLVFSGEDVALGEFHCWPGDPRWRSENRAAEGPLVVFPGTSVVIEHASGPVVATPNHVMFYNRGQVYRRRLLHPRGDHCAFVVAARYWSPSAAPVPLSAGARAGGSSSR